MALEPESFSKPQKRPIRRTVATALSGLAFLLCIVATIYMLNVPIYQGFETVSNADGQQTIKTTKTLVEANGDWVIYQLMLVTMVSGVPVWMALVFPRGQRPTTWVCALLLAAYSIAGAMTVGGAYMPGALLLLLAGMVMLFEGKLASSRNT